MDRYQNQSYVRSMTMTEEMSLEFSTYVILPASGCGERMNCHKPKQYMTVCGKELFMYAVEAFHGISWVKKIIVCVSEAYRDHMTDIVTKAGLDRVVIVTGAETRHRSIQCGVHALSKFELSQKDVVVVHDVVRPFITEDLVSNVARAAFEFGAAGVTRPLVSTVIQPDSNSNLATSLDRSHYRASEMPQAFCYGHIKTAYEQCSTEDLDHGTECLLLSQKYTDATVKLLDGPDYLWKVTLRRDLHMLEACLKERDLGVGLVDAPNDLSESLHCAFRDRHIQCTDELQISHQDQDNTTLITFKHHPNYHDFYQKHSLSRKIENYVTVILFKADVNHADFYANYRDVIMEVQDSGVRVSVCLLVKNDYNASHVTKVLTDLICNLNSSLHNQVLII